GAHANAAFGKCVGGAAQGCGFRRVGRDALIEDEGDVAFEGGNSRFDVHVGARAVLGAIGAAGGCHVFVGTGRMVAVGFDAVDACLEIGEFARGVHHVPPVPVFGWLIDAGLVEQGFVVDPATDAVAPGEAIEATVGGVARFGGMVVILF